MKLLLVNLTMSSYLFANPSDLMINLTTLPNRMYTDNYTLMDQVESENGYGHEEVLDKTKEISTGDFIKYFESVRKMYAYLTPDYLDSWKVFLTAILEQNKSAPLIEFHFVYNGDRSSLPFYFRATRQGASSIKFATFVGEGNAPWCFSMQAVDSDDSDFEDEEKENEEEEEEKEEIDESELPKKGSKRKAPASKKESKKKKIVRRKNKFDIELYRKHYATHVSEHRITPQEDAMFRHLSNMRNNMFSGGGGGGGLGMFGGGGGGRFDPNMFRF